MKDLLTPILLELLPFIQENNIPIEVALMLADLKLAQSINKPFSKEEAPIIISTFMRLNIMLKSIVNPGEAYIKLFDNTPLETAKHDCPKWFICLPKGNAFLQLRQKMYQELQPEVVILLDQLQKGHLTKAA